MTSKSAAPLPANQQRRTTTRLHAVAQQGNLLSLRNVSLTLSNTHILEAIDLTIARQEFVCLVGPSGSGKTTLLRLLGGLLPPTDGIVEYEGQPLRGPSQEIAIIFQDYTNALLPWRSVRGNVSLALESLHVPRPDRAARIDELLKLVGLDHRADSLPSQLSGGMQQRVQIARCLAQEPTTLLMDEPFGALDAMTRQHLQDEVQRIVAARGMTVCFVTHDIEEAIYLGDRVIALRSDPGRIAGIFDVPLPRPRNQLTTPEHPDFLKLRRELFRFIEDRE